MPGDVRRSSATAGSYLNNFLFLEVDGAGHMPIELDAVTIRLLGFIEHDLSSVGIKAGVAIVHEGDVAVAVDYHEQLVPDLDHPAF